MSVTYNPETNQTIYLVKQLDSDEETSSTDQIINIIDKTDNKACFPIEQLQDWRRIIGDPKATLDDIIDQLDFLAKEDPKYKEALTEAKKMKFQNVTKDRKSTIIKKELNPDQFNTRIKVDYDKKQMDEQYKIVRDSREYHKDLSVKTKPDNRKAPVNWGTRTIGNVSRAPNSNNSNNLDWIL